MCQITLYTQLPAQDYETDAYLRQEWIDPRLSHEDITSPLDLADPKLVQAIWKPEVSLKILLKFEISTYWSNQPKVKYCPREASKSMFG